MYKSLLGNKSLPRGLRNNNPGNLRITTIKWQGKIPKEKNTDGAFEQFVDLRHGIRAMAKDLTNDISKGANTITKLITQFAPPSENDTRAYINSVVKQTGITADKILSTDAATLRKLMKAILNHENGADAAKLVTDKDFDDAFSLMGIVTDFIEKKKE